MVTNSPISLETSIYPLAEIQQQRALQMHSHKPHQRIEAIKRDYILFAPEGKPWRTVRDVLSDVPHPKLNHGIADHIFRDGARTYPGHTGSCYDLPAKTIKAGGHGVPGGENMIRYPDGSIRYFTVFEAKRIQTFPDDYVITGAWGEALRQIGNAVPVKLGEHLGTAAMTLLKQAAESSSQSPVRSCSKRGVLNAFATH